MNNIIIFLFIRKLYRKMHLVVCCKNKEKKIKNKLKQINVHLSQILRKKLKNQSLMKIFITKQNITSFDNNKDKKQEKWKKYKKK